MYVSTHINCHFQNNIFLSVSVLTGINSKGIFSKMFFDYLHPISPRNLRLVRRSVENQFKSRNVEYNLKESL